MARKVRQADDYVAHLYMHIQEDQRFALLSGLHFEQFIQFAQHVRHLLLLKYPYEDSSFNMHTLLEFVANEDLPSFKKSFEDKPGELCWIDFSSEKQLNQLTPNEQAELYYLGHKKEPLHSPFFQTLQNRYVYLANEQENLVKIYFYQIQEAFALVQFFFNQLIASKKSSSAFWRRKAMPVLPQLTSTQMESLRPYLREGVILSLYEIDKPKNTYELEARVLPDTFFPDEVWEEKDNWLKSEPNGIFIIS